MEYTYYFPSESVKNGFSKISDDNERYFSETGKYFRSLIVQEGLRICACNQDQF